MMITLDKNKCKQCGICIELMKGYCISEVNLFPSFDASLCNTCQKCVAICPFQAIMVNGVYPDKITSKNNINSEEVYSLFEKRRSIKHYIDKPIPREIVQKIVSVAKLAPNQNKNISLKIIDDKQLITEIDKCAINFVKTIYKVMFSFKLVELFIKLFYRDISIIKKKMEYNSFSRVIHENTQVIIIVTGNKKIAVTESSAHYMLSTMMYMAEVFCVGSCLMDSIYLALRTNKKMRQKLYINEDVLGVLVLGYSNEKIINVPHGYEVNIKWNNEK